MNFWERFLVENIPHTLTRVLFVWCILLVFGLVLALATSSEPSPLALLHAVGTGAVTFSFVTLLFYFLSLGLQSIHPFCALARYTTAHDLVEHFVSKPSKHVWIMQTYMPADTAHSLHPLDVILAESPSPTCRIIVPSTAFAALRANRVPLPRRGSAQRMWVPETLAGFFQ